MMNRLVNQRLWLVIILFFVLVSCQEDPPLPDNLASFESAQLGFAATEDNLTVNINFSRAVSESGILTVNFVPNEVIYGIDFTTVPAAINTSIQVPVASGATQVSFTVTKNPDVLLDGDESILFSITDASAGLIIGPSSELELSFAEILSAQAIMNINGGGATYPNKVFIDLTANRQTAVTRTQWDLGFFTGSDFRAILNSSNGMMARALDKTNLNEVTAADTVGFGSQLSLSAVFAAALVTPAPTWITEAKNWIDDPSGDLTKTAIASISATDSENKVYIINRGSGVGSPAPDLGWKKIRILRNGAGYKIQYADISATTFEEIQINKDAAFNFVYFSFQNGTVAVEPEKERWDIAWTGFTNLTALGPPGSPLIPYYFQDVVLQNRNGVETAELLIANAGSYENFGEEDLAGITFSTNQLGIGSNWRSGGGPGTAPAVRTDRFYLVKDADGNIYKLRFTALTQDGERGRPQIEFALLQQGV